MLSGVNKFKYKLLLLALIVSIGLVLRIHNLGIWPRLGATFDEYAWTWQGMNLIQRGIPISWSPHSQYTDAESTIYQETHFRIVKPFLEHPPIFGLVAGSFAIANGASGMYDLDITKIRPLAVILGILSILFLYLLVSELYGKKIAILASFLYATVPTVVIGSRIVQNENFFIPMWLLALWFISKYIKGRNKLFRNLAVFICGLLILAKIPWIAASGSAFLIFLFLKRYKDAAIFFVTPIVSLGIFIAYGVYYDADLFFNLWGLQLARYDLTFSSIFALFQKPFLADRFLTDGWIYFGWFAFILLLIKDLKKHFVVIFALLSYFVIFLSGIPDEAGHGWYRYPFYPFLIISIALFIKDYFVKNWILTFFFLVVVGTSLLNLTWEKTFGFSYIIFRLSIIGWLMVLIPQFFPSKKLDKFGKIVGYFWLIVFFLMSIWAVFLYNEQ